MKITNVEPIFLGIPYDHGAPRPQATGFGNWDVQPLLLVRVDTDAGVTGWGEAFSHSSTPVTITATKEIVAKLAIGRDPSDISRLMYELTRKVHSMARGGGPVLFALSGLEIALWDIAGKLAGKPVWQLLGGTERKASIPAYASLFRLEKPDLVARVCGKAIERGYRDIKLHEHAAEEVAAARKAIGPDVRLMVDTNCYWDKPDDIIAVCKAIEPYDVTWLEEPLYPADAYDEEARIRREVRVPFAAGENLGNLHDVRLITDKHSVDIVQPSVCKIGGITELRKAMTYIESKGLRAVPHTPFLGPALVAVIHVLASMAKDIPCEHRFCDLEASPLGDAVVSHDGRLAVPDRPGLGFEVDMKVVEKYRVG